MTLGVGLIGVGGIASHHIRGYRQADARIVQVADANEDLARQRAEELACEWTSDYQELLRREDIQAVSICVPNWLHYQVARDAVEAGKAVLCEKPMTTRLEQAEELVRLVRERGVYFQVGYMKRYHLVAQKFREWISALEPVETGLLRCYQPFPEDLWAEPNFWFTKKELAGGGPLVHGGSHMFDLLHWCLGEVEAVDARVRMRPGTDVDWFVNGIIEMRSGATILLEVGWFEHTNWGRMADGWDEMFQLRSRRGVLTFYPTFWDRPMHLVPSTELYLQQEHMLQRFAVGPVDYFVEEIKDFVRRVSAGLPSPVTVEDGHFVDRLIDALYRSGEERARLLL
ncbi:MAG: Gfo/Idh/MocA family oxidoreductase [Anaerolineae bacterium]|nr:Gfo/Idh/MocA family oxidoreductase [Anaerolineae bacterium]